MAGHSRRLLPCPLDRGWKTQSTKETDEVVGRVTEASPFGTRLRRLRKAAGLTQEELADRAGLTARGISDLERGARKRPYPHT
ncbi:MAG: helix-turn-helix domain-containing protein, partial [Rubrobacter sp.]